MFVLPAVLFGFIVAFPIIHYLYQFLFASTSDYMPSTIPSSSAITRALLSGILIPILSSIIPIRRVLAKNLTETLRVDKGENKGNKVVITDLQTKDIAPYLLFGSASVIFGTIIYYGLPVAMLEVNLGLMLSIFFLILMGLILGLVLFAINLKTALELLLMSLLLFWETKSMKKILRKNMTFHK